MSTLDRQVSQSSDDCARHKNNDYWSIVHTAPGLGYYGPTFQRCGSACRFLDITIEAGATITVAHLTARANTTLGLTVVNLRIRGQDSNNPATFSTQADFDARTWLATTVDWDNVPPMVAGQDYQSPDISAIFQALIDKYAGLSSAPVALSLDDWDRRSTQENGRYRTLVHYDGNPTYALKLHLEWTPPVTAEFVPLRTAVDGYRCFMQQYVKNKILGADPWKLPDGTKW